MTQRAILAILVVSFAAPPAFGQSAPPSKREIAEALASPDSHLRHNTWKRLNPEKSSDYSLLLKILKGLGWHDRNAAVEALTKASSEKTLEKMAKSAIADSHPFVRQGLCEALALMKDPRYYPTLYEAVKDKHPYVRRMVVYYLGFMNKEANVDVLVGVFQNEKDPVVRTFIESSLNQITQAYQGPHPAMWQLWWDRAKADPDFELGKTDEESLRKAEELGRKLKENSTQVAGVDLDTSERGAGSPILILPTYGYSKNTMLPFLSELEKNHKLIYMDLPPIKSFKGLASVSAKNIVYYPIDRLVEAFEALRKQTGETHFAIMACGMSSWIAMRYAQKYPKSVAAMIFVAPISSTEEYGRATDRLERQGKGKNDQEMHYYSLSRKFDPQTGEGFLEKYHRDKDIPKTPGEDAAIGRREWSLHFMEERDGMLAMLYPNAHDPGAATVAIPPFDLQKEEKPASGVPALVISGGRDLITSGADGKKIAEYYGGKQLVFKNSACMPFAEQSPEFNTAVAGFLKFYARRKPKELVEASKVDDEVEEPVAAKKSSRSSSSSGKDGEKKKRRQKPRPKKASEDGERDES